MSGQYLSRKRDCQITPSEAVMNPLTVNPAIVLQHARQVAREDAARHARRDRAIRAAQRARAALERAGG